MEMQALHPLVIAGRQAIAQLGEREGLDFQAWKRGVSVGQVKEEFRKRFLHTSRISDGWMTTEIAR
ncbi:hypothetical protein D3C72_2493080 [compost metagenome]